MELIGAIIFTSFCSPSSPPFRAEELKSKQPPPSPLLLPFTSSPYKNHTLLYYAQKIMASSVYCMLLILFVLSGFHAIVGAQDLRAPHGLAYESPAAADGGAAVSPEAYAFFNPAAASKNSSAAAQFPNAAASSLESNLARDSVAKTEDGGGGGGGMVGILIGFLFVVVLVLGVFFVVTTRKRNWTKANATADMPQA